MPITAVGKLGGAERAGPVAYPTQSLLGSVTSQM
jgi:hypothetical protein